MSSATNTSSPVLKRFTSVRPPAVGEEVKIFHDTSHSEQQYKNWNMDYNSKTTCGESVDQSVSSCTDSVTETRDCIDNSPNPSPPPALKWAQSLQCLLEDRQGYSLFKKFLRQEGEDSCIEFWCASRGIKREEDKFSRLINKIYSKYVIRIPAISDETKKEIWQRIASNTDVNNTIFDKALQEVEAYMMKTTYPNFLKSDLYIQHLSGYQNELSPKKERVVTPEPTESLPTVHEDSELLIPSKIPLTKTNLLQRNKSSYVSKFKAEASSSGLLRSPYSNYSNYHTKYNAFLPVSAQDSELQSLSSDAQTDDTMSLTDGSNADYPTHSRSKHKRPQKIMKHLNNPIDNKDEIFIPRTERLPDTTKQLSPKEFHAALVKELNKVIEDRKNAEKVNEKLKAVEDPEPSRPCEAPVLPVPPVDASARQYHKGNSNNVFEHGFLAYSSTTEENVQDILDQHISRVFDSGQHTPAQGMLSPTVPRPSSDSRVPVPGSSEPQEYSYKHNMKYRRDHDTYSKDSAMYQSSDNLTTDYSKRYKEHSKRFASKKFSSMTDSRSSFFDSGISCESVPSYSKVTHWLETKRMAEQEREQPSWRNSSTSPVLSRSSSSRKTGYNSSWGGNLDVQYSQYTSASQNSGRQYSHDFTAPGFSAPDTTSNLVEARKRLEDENRAKMRIKKLAKKYGNAEPSSNDVTIVGYSYGRHAVPYLSKIPGKNVTLRQFKSLLSKKGNFRYFFKTARDDLGTGVVFEEVTEDCKVLPLWEGKLFCVIESIDDNAII